MSSPLEEFRQENNDRWTVLQDIPPWEYQRIKNWLGSIFNYHVGDNLYGRSLKFNSGAISSIETTNHLLLDKDLGIEATSWPGLSLSIDQLYGTDDKKIIMFLEMLVKFIRDNEHSNVIFNDNLISPSQVVQLLERILANGSKWTVVEERYAIAGFVERVDGRIVNMAASLKNSDLNKAWEAAYRVDPRPEEAIEKAQKAVEDIATEAGLSKDTTSVYGKLIGSIRTGKSQQFISAAKSSYDLSNKLAGEKSKGEDINDEFTDWFWKTLDLIQKSNPGHHASPVTKGFKVSVDAARQAVIMATLACHFIEQGYISAVAAKSKQD